MTRPDRDVGIDATRDAAPSVTAERQLGQLVDAGTIREVPGGGLLLPEGP